MTALVVLIALAALAIAAWGWDTARVERRAADHWRARCAELERTIEEQTVTIAQLYGQVSRQVRTFVLSRGGLYKGES